LSVISLNLFHYFATKIRQLKSQQLQGFQNHPNCHYRYLISKIINFYWNCNYIDLSCAESVCLNYGLHVWKQTNEI